MSIALVLFFLVVLVITPSDVVLSVLIGVGGCGWPIAMSVCLIGIACVEIKNKAPNSDSTADGVPDLISVHKQ